MVSLKLQEDRPTPKAVYNWRVYTCAAIASFASCTIGYDSGTSSVLPFLSPWRSACVCAIAC